MSEPQSKMPEKEETIFIEKECQRDIELAKVQAYSSDKQTTFKFSYTLTIGIFFSGAAIYYSRYSLGLTTFESLNWGIGGGYVLFVAALLGSFWWYRTRIKKVGKALAMIENGKSLPSDLDDL